MTCSGRKIVFPDIRMTTPFRFDAALLAGGRSTRFTSDKAFHDWRGRPLYVAQLRKLAALEPDRLWLSTNADQVFPEVLSGVERIIDDEPDLGPLGGLRAVLRRSEAPYVLVLAVDLPLMEAAFLSSLIQAGKGLVGRSDRGWEPLAALYPREAMLALIEASLAAGRRRLQDLLDEAEALALIEALPLSGRTARFFANLNSPADLLSLEQGQCDEAILLHRFRSGSGYAEESDRVASEEPLEIRVNGTSVAVTMRTPGHDDELATGFLFTESLITRADEIAEIVHCPDVDPEGIGNTLDVRLRTDPDLASLTRHVFTSSSCGVCGKATIESVFQHFPPVAGARLPSGDLLLSLPAKLREAQATFDRTGGLHASALFDAEGNLLLLREDVGRHNALDKVIGHALKKEIPLRDVVLLVSGRISFELMQKALAARIPVVAGISAPSSLAVKLAREGGQVLVGFLRERGFNVYAEGDDPASSR
jgi:FdhD protein